MTKDRIKVEVETENGQWIVSQSLKNTNQLRQIMLTDVIADSEAKTIIDAIKTGLDSGGCRIVVDGKILEAKEVYRMIYN